MVWAFSGAILWKREIGLNFLVWPTKLISLSGSLTGNHKNIKNSEYLMFSFSFFHLRRGDSRLHTIAVVLRLERIRTVHSSLKISHPSEHYFTQWPAPPINILTVKLHMRYKYNSGTTLESMRWRHMFVSTSESFDDHCWCAATSITNAC